MSIYDEMVAQLADRVGTATPNVEQEVMQRIALAGLQRGGFSSMQHFTAVPVFVYFITCLVSLRTWTVH